VIVEAAEEDIAAAAKEAIEEREKP